MKFLRRPFRLSYDLDSDPDLPSKLNPPPLYLPVLQIRITLMRSGSFHIDADPDLDPASHFDPDLDRTFHIDPDPSFK